VLRPGGVFVASTFLTPFAPIGELLGDDTVRPISQVRGARAGFSWESVARPTHWGGPPWLGGCAWMRTRGGASQEAMYG
jgi:hypothetical protein